MKVARPTLQERSILLASLPRYNPKPVILSSTKGKILYANPAAEKLVNELEVSSCKAILPQHHQTIVLSLLCSKKEFPEKQITVRIKRNKLRWYYRYNDQMGLVYLYADQLETLSEKKVDKIKEALHSGEIEPFYQPILDVKEQRLAGYEALARWCSPSLGIIPPQEFIPIAERSGLIAELDMRMLRKTCEQFVLWHQLYPQADEITISANLSARTLMDSSLLSEVEQILQSTEISGSTLCLEITETSLIENPDEALYILEKIKKLGIKIALDDFGTGYSSLSLLHRFPIDRIKIDRSFIRSLGEDKKGDNIVAAMIGLGKQLNIEILAEGVENCQQYLLLQSLECTHIQGFLLGTPQNQLKTSQILEEMTSTICENAEKTTQIRSLLQRLLHTVAQVTCLEENTY